MKKTVFRIHSWLGLTLGLVLAAMGTSGALLAYEHEISQALAPAYFAPGIPAAPDLTPDRLARQLAQANPGFAANRIDWETARGRTIAVRLSNPANVQRRSGRVNRASGAWLPEPAPVAFFASVERFHRWLLLPGNGNGPGRIVTGLGALALLGFAVTGLILRWPRTRRQWRRLLLLDFTARKGRLRMIHRVTGIWLIPFYLISAATGLWWSSETYRKAVMIVLTGHAVREGGSEPRSGAGHAASAPSWHADKAWAAFRASTGTRYAWIRITLQQNGDRVQFEARPADARHAKQIDQFVYQAASGERISTKPYASRSLGEILSRSMLEVHRGAFFGPVMRAAMLVSSLALSFFAISGLLFWKQRRRKGIAARAKPARPAIFGARPQQDQGSGFVG